jgi:hypothetical protein
MSNEEEFPFQKKRLREDIPNDMDEIVPSSIPAKSEKMVLVDQLCISASTTTTTNRFLRRIASAPMEYIRNVSIFAPRPEWLHPTSPTVFGKERDHILNLAIRHSNHSVNTTFSSETLATLEILGMAPSMAFQRMPVAPLILAAQRGNPFLVQTILEKYGTTANSNDDNDNNNNIQNYTIDSAKAVLQAAHFGHVDILRIFFMRNTDDGAACSIMDQPNLNHTTPLMRAAQEGHLLCVQFLLDTGQVHVNKRNRQGMTALMLASQRGHADVVKLLIEKANAQLDIPTIPNRSTALLLACKRGHVPVMRVLVEHGCEVLAMDANRRTVRTIVRKHIAPTHPPEVAKSILELCGNPLQQIHAMRLAAARRRNWELCKLWYMQNAPTNKHTTTGKVQFRSDCWEESDTRMIYHVTHHFPLPLLIQVAQYLPLPPLYSQIIVMLMNRCAVEPNSTIVTAFDILDEILEGAGILQACDECQIPTPKLPRTGTSIFTWTELQRLCVFQNRIVQHHEPSNFVTMSGNSQIGQGSNTRPDQQQPEEEDQEDTAHGMGEVNGGNLGDDADDVENNVHWQHRGQQERTNITNITIELLPESPTIWQFRRHVGYPRLLAANPLLVSYLRNRPDPRIPPHLLPNIINIADLERIVRRCCCGVEESHHGNHHISTSYSGIRFEPRVAIDIVLLISRLVSFDEQR